VNHGPVGSTSIITHEADLGKPLKINCWLNEDKPLSLYPNENEEGLYPWAPAYRWKLFKDREGGGEPLRVQDDVYKVDTDDRIIVDPITGE